MTLNIRMLCASDLEDSSGDVPAAYCHCRSFRNFCFVGEGEGLARLEGDEVIAPVCRYDVFAGCVLEGES